MRISDIMASAGPAQKPDEQEPTAVPAGMKPATEEEQQIYEKVVLAGMKILYDDKTRDKILATLKARRDAPAQGLAQVAQTLITQIDEQSGGTIPEAVILPAAGEILEHLAELAQVSGAMKVNETVLGKAGQLMVLGLAEEYGVDPQSIQSLLDEVPPEQIREMVQKQAEYDRAEIEGEPAEIPQDDDDMPDDEEPAPDDEEPMPEGEEGA